MYFLYCIVVDTLHVTSADYTNDESSFLKTKPSASASDRVHEVINVVSLEFARQQMKLTQDEMHSLLERFVEDLPISSVLSVPKENVLINQIRLMVEEKVSRWEKRQIAKAINMFNAEFFKVIQPVKWQASAFSPFIVYTSLLLAAFVAKGERREYFDAALNLGENGIRYDVTEYKNFSDTINSIDSSVLKLRFKYFYSRDLRVECSFEDKAMEIFETKNQVLGFGESSLQEDRNTIVNWFAKELHTTNLQEELVNITKGINNQTRLVIATVGYFNGALERGLRFEENASFLKNDSPNDKSTTQYYCGASDYYHGDLPDIDAKFIELPLKQVGSSPPLSLLVIHPNKVGGCANVLKDFSKVMMKFPLQGNTSRVQIRMPKIGFNSTVDVTQALWGIEFVSILRPADELDGVIEADDHIENIYHKTVIDIAMGSDLRSRELEPCEEEGNIVEFNVRSSHIYAVVVKEPRPIVLFIGQSA